VKGRRNTRRYPHTRKVGFELRECSSEWFFQTTAARVLNTRKPVILRVFAGVVRVLLSGPE
jgi:hypothetical protein